MGSIDFWHWFILGALLIILEVFAPGAFFLWMGVAAGVVGLILWVSPDMGWEMQLLIFAIISVFSIALWRMRLNKHPTETEEPSLNVRTRAYVGRVFHLSKAIVDGYGEIHVDDVYWKVKGEDRKKGARVRVVSTDGLTLNVEPVD